MGIFNSTCPIPAGAENYGNRGSAWHYMVWIALGCCLVTVALSLSLIILHLRRYRAPKEQRQILRIVFSVVVYSIVAFFELYSYKVAQYIDPIGDLYESFGLCALYLLFIQYAAPTNKYNEDTLADVRVAAEHESTFDWVRVSWVFVFQYPVIETICVIIQEVTQVFGVYCLESLDPVFAHLWIEIIDSVSIGACVLAIVRFYTSMKKLMKVRRGLSKIIAFKAIVGIRFFQAWIFSTLLQHNVIKTSTVYSYNDILYGIPAVLSCAEMVVFALGFWYAFSASEYSSSIHKRAEPLPIWRAVIHAMNPSDLIGGIARIPYYFVQLHRGGDWKQWRTNFWQTGINGAIRNGIKKVQNRGKGGDGSGNPSSRSQELDEGLESLARPPAAEIMTAHHGRVESNDSAAGEYPLAHGGGVDGMYQPPAYDSSPDETTSYLMADSTSYNGGSHHSRSPSGSYLIVEGPSGSGGIPPINGHWNGQRYDRTPSPDPRFEMTPTQGRDAV